MKTVFMCAFIGLIVSSFATWLKQPEQATGRPVLYWVTDANPVRDEQVAAFHAWQEAHLPPEERYTLRIDVANNAPHKKVIQSVSGVGGQIMDVRGVDELHYFARMGILADLSDMAMGDYDFAPGKTHPAVADQLAVDGRQYVFPCNLSTNLYWVNRDALRRFDIALPEADWHWDDFERAAVAFIERANAGLPYRQFFFANDVDLLVLARAAGGDVMDETLSAPTVDRPAFIAGLERLLRWRHELRILPTRADVQAVSAESAHGGTTVQLFREGRVPLLLSGRWALCQFREWSDFGDMGLAVLPQPVDPGGFRNCLAKYRAAGIYRGASARDRRLAGHFISFLASEAYAQTVVASGDALPPLPSAMQGEAFLRPPGHANEWGIHGAFARHFSEVGIPIGESPFVTSTYCERELRDAIGAVMTQPPLRSPAEAMARMQRRIEERIALNIAADPALAERYAVARARQARIDELRAAGEPVPVELIANVYHRRLLRATGGLVEETR